jgi:GR25 family glycosyltransferase involved in LPS biosynthesis
LDIYLINLDRSTDRLTQFQSLNGNIMPLISRFSAVEGKNVQRATYIERGIITADLSYSDGTLGNALSHLALWDIAILNERPVTICEDDAIFNTHFGESSKCLLAELPPDWHIVLWGWNFSSILWFHMLPNVLSSISHFDQQMMRTGISGFQTAMFQPSAFKLIQTFGTVCYSVSPEGARLLRQFCLPIRNMNIPIPPLQRVVPNQALDVLLNSFYRRLNSFVSFPPLVVTKNERRNSTVRNPDGSLKS